MKINELKQHLNGLSKEDLVKDILDLYRKSNFVQSYLNAKYDTEKVGSILEQYKKIIEHEFFPAKGDGRARLSVAKKAITEFRKISKDAQSNAELMVFYVEIGVKYTDYYGDIDEAFYTSMESMYQRAVKFIIGESLGGEFEERCRKIVENTVNMGWGFHDGLADTYYEYFVPDDASV
jgi:hypothetical protein